MEIYNGTVSIADLLRSGLAPQCGGTKSDRAYLI